LTLHSASRVDVEEGGTTDSYQLALLSIPTANVQITVDPDGQTDLGAGAGNAIVLAFTPANALIPQTVTVTAVDDGAVEGVHTSIITHSLSSVDANYNGLAVSDVVANIVDNDAPPPTSIVISELMYNPASDETSPGVGEWIEIVNTGTSATDLSGWYFDDEDATNWGSIPSGTILYPGQVAVFFDADFTTAANFRTEWSVPASALVVGLSWGNLANSPSPTNEILQLLNSVGVEMDLVNYDDSSPWPTGIDGPSIYLTNLSLDNNVGSNWARSIVGTAKAVSPSGPTFNASDVGSPGRVFLPGDYDSNGSVGAGDYVVWRKTLGSTTNPQADGSGPTTGVPNGIVDQFDYTYWRSNFGFTGAMSGAGSGSGASEGAAGASLSAPEQTSASANEAAVDTAIIDLSFPASPQVGTTSSKHVLPYSEPVLSAATADSLLLAIERTEAPRPGNEPATIETDALLEADEAADLFLAWLDESALTSVSPETPGKQDYASASDRC
jgi:hypothetical protein